MPFQEDEAINMDCDGVNQRNAIGGL